MSCTFIFFFNDTATTEIYTLSLHDALPICYRAHQGKRRYHGCVPEVCAEAPQRPRVHEVNGVQRAEQRERVRGHVQRVLDRKSTRLNSSHANISYAVFCLKKKNIIILVIIA